MRYMLPPEGDKCVLRINDDESITSIPTVEDNSEYKDYLTWLSHDNTPDPWVDAPVPDGEVAP